MCNQNSAGSGNAFADEINGDSDYNNRAYNDLGKVTLHAQKHQTITDHGYRHRADQGAEYAAGTAAHAHAANDCRGNGLHFIGLSGGRLGGAETGHINDCRQADGNTGNRVNFDDIPFNPHTGQPGGFRVGADGVDISAGGGPGQNHMGQDADGNEDVNRKRNPQQKALSDKFEPLMIHRNLRGVGHPQRQTPEDIHGAQGHDKGRDFDEGNHKAIDGTGQRANCHRHQHSKPHTAGGVDGHAGEHAAECQQGALGQIHRAGDNHKGHAGAHNGVNSGLAQDLHDVVVRSESIRKDAQKQADHSQRKQRAQTFHLLQPLHETGLTIAFFHAQLPPII